MSVHEKSVGIGATKVRGLLGLLAYKCNEPVSAGYLVDALWDDDDRPPEPVKTLQVYVSRLRRALVRTGFAATVVGEHGTYRLVVEPSLVDYSCFVAMVRTGRREYGRGEHLSAAEFFEAALGLWRGVPIADLTTSSARRLQGSLVTRDFLSAQGALLDAKLALGAHQFVLEHLPGLLADHPLDDRLAGLWMRALAAADRSSEVPAFFRDFSQRHEAEFNVGPSQSLVGIYQNSATPEIVRMKSPGDDRRIPEPPRGTPHFTGRAELLAELDALLLGPSPAASVVALDGHPGVGKTALVRHWARRHVAEFPDGFLHMDLAGYSGAAPVEPGTVMGSFLKDLGVPAAHLKIGADERATLLRHKLGRRRMLVILDNVRDSAHVRPLLAATANCPVVITSRRRLTGVTVRDGAEHITVPGLSAEEATALLANRIGRRAAEDPKALGDLLALCDRMPLAILIAAEHVAARPGVPVRDLVDELQAHRLLDAGAHGDDDTTTLRSAFSWSYRALPPAQGHVFRILGLLPGPRFHAAAVAAASGLGHEQVDGILDALVGAHLVEQERAGRYRTHDLLRLYAADSARRDEPAEARDRAIRRVLSWYVESAGNARPLLTPDPHEVPALPEPEPVEPVTFGSLEDARRWFTFEWPNIVALARLAASLGHHEAVWRLAAYLNVMNDHGDLRELLDIQVLGQSSARTAGRPAAEAGCLTSMGVLYGKLKDNLRAARCFEQAYHAFRAAGDAHGEAVGLHNIGCIHLQFQDPVTAISWHRRALAAFSAVGNELGIANVHRWLGDDYRALDQYEEAHHHYLSAQLMSQKVGHLHGQGETLNRLAKLYLDIGRPDQAVRSGELALDLHDRIGDRGGAADVLCTLAKARIELGQYPEAMTNAREAARTHEEMRNAAAQATALETLSEAQARSGEPEEARTTRARATALLPDQDDSQAAILTPSAIPEVPSPRHSSQAVQAQAEPSTKEEAPRQEQADH